MDSGIMYLNGKKGFDNASLSDGKIKKLIRKIPGFRSRALTESTYLGDLTKIEEKAAQFEKKSGPVIAVVKKLTENEWIGAKIQKAIVKVGIERLFKIAKAASRIDIAVEVTKIVTMVAAFLEIPMPVLSVATATLAKVWNVCGAGLDIFQHQLLRATVSKVNNPEIKQQLEKLYRLFSALSNQEMVTDIKLLLIPYGEFFRSIRAIKLENYQLRIIKEMERLYKNPSAQPPVAGLLTPPENV